VGSAAASNAPWSAAVETRSAKLDIHVIVARESRRGEILGTGLDPLDRPPELQRANDRADVAGVDRHFVAEAAANVWRDDVDLVLRNTGHQRERGPVNVRRLGGNVELQPAHGVEVSHTAARLERSGMTSLEPDALADALRARLERTRGGVPVADFPMIDMVRLRLAVRPQEDFVLLGRERVGDDWQRLVLHLHRFRAVGRRAACLGKHRRDLLVLEEHLADGQHHLLVEPVERRQPAKARGFEILAGDDRLDTGHFHSLRGVDALDQRMGVRTARDRRIQHAGEREVVHIAPLSLQEARIFLPLHAVTQRVTFFLCVDGHGCDSA
jgi:hypothetical protein